MKLTEKQITQIVNEAQELEDENQHTERLVRIAMDCAFCASLKADNPNESDSERDRAEAARRTLGQFERAFRALGKIADAYGYCPEHIYNARYELAKALKDAIAEFFGEDASNRINP